MTQNVIGARFTIPWFGGRRAKEKEQPSVRAIGPVLVMVFSHLLMLYLFIAWRCHGGRLYYPRSIAEIPQFFAQLWSDLVQHATPSWESASVYLAFLLIQAAFAWVLPGPVVSGLPLPSEGGRRLTYRCNGLWSWYATLALVALLHVTGIYPLQRIYEHAGETMIVAMLVSNIIAVAVYVGAVRTGKTCRMTGNIFVDFFMGASLNPRIGSLDLKMWAETRVSWITLFLLTLGAAGHQYATYGELGTPLIFMIVAHGLYANACMKGEECIPTTWDIFHEKWGWMLVFWNLAGVPFVYAFNSMYLASRPPFEHSWLYTAACFVLLLGAYYVWDTAQSQRNRFRMQLNGSYIERKAFPQLPWGTLENPRYMDTAVGSKLLVDGWWAYARKIHYTADILMALSWGLICGFDHYLPFFYVTFFTIMIVHRNGRDVARCRQKYGADWDRYCERVPYVFIPYVY